MFVVAKLLFKSKPLSRNTKLFDREGGKKNTTPTQQQYPLENISIAHSSQSINLKLSSFFLTIIIVFEGEQVSFPYCNILNVSLFLFFFSGLAKKNPYARMDDQ